MCIGCLRFGKSVVYVHFRTSLEEVLQVIQVLFASLMSTVNSDNLHILFFTSYIESMLFREQPIC